jgi:hypothetical protein
MAELDRLVLCCSNNLPVTVLEEPINGSFELCSCCEDSPSMEVINLPCCKASVHRHCVLEALQSNNQYVYCWIVLDPQDIINCTTLWQLKAPPDANISQTEIFANMNLHNILGEASVQDEDMNLWEEPVQDEESSMSGILTFVKNN